MPLNILITGGSGQVGWELARCARDQTMSRDHWIVHAPDRAELDLSRPDSIPEIVQRVRPDVILNAAGYTAVDRAESEPELAHRVNAEAVAVLAAEARSCGAIIVHYSTDYIFDGAKDTPYRPDDPPNPQSVYGHSKLRGEHALRESGARYLLLRTQWVYAMRGRNFVLAILRQAASKPELRVVNDQVGAPTWARSIARATVEIVARHVSGSPADRRLSGHEGAYHLVCGGATSWFDFARAIFEETGLPTPKITPVSTRDFGARAERPAHAVLDCSLTESTFGVRMPDWRAALREAVSDRAALQAATTPIPIAHT